MKLVTQEQVEGTLLIQLISLVGMLAKATIKDLKKRMLDLYTLHTMRDGKIRSTFASRIST